MTAKETDFEHPPRGHVATLFYDIVNHRFQVVQGDDVDAAIPATAKAPLASSLAHGYDGALWRKLALLWGFSNSLWGEVSDTAEEDATLFLVGATVQPGEVWVVNKISWYRDTNAEQNMRLSVYTGDAYVNLVDYPVPAVTTFYEDDMRGVLEAGERLRFGFASATTGEYCEAHYWGYKMHIDM